MTRFFPGKGGNGFSDRHSPRMGKALKALVQFLSYPPSLVVAVVAVVFCLRLTLGRLQGYSIDSDGKRDHASVNAVEIDGHTVAFAPPEYVMIRKMEFFREGG